jgi:hypothetical protein
MANFKNLTITGLRVYIGMAEAFIEDSISYLGELDSDLDYAEFRGDANAQKRIKELIANTEAEIKEARRELAAMEHEVELRDQRQQRRR